MSLYDPILLEEAMSAMKEAMIIDIIDSLEHKNTDQEISIESIEA